MGVLGMEVRSKERKADMDGRGKSRREHPKEEGRVQAVIFVSSKNVRSEHFSVNIFQSRD